ncbi:MAG: CopG family transcriptional regulator [Ilumatobacteraceae bacterium]
MRTTLSIDDDVLVAARERARRERRSIGEVVSDLARQALTATEAPPSTEFYGFRPLPARGGPVTNTLVDQLREEEAV